MDWKCLFAMRQAKNLIVVWYLVYQYIRHVLGIKILSDRVYLTVRKQLLWEWEEINHPYKDILSKEDVICDIPFSAHGPSYPTSVITGGALYLKEFHSRQCL